jgi:hypothetical protein
MDDISIKRFYIVLLLGSYDPDTKKLLSNLKDRITQQLMYYNDTVLIFSLENLEIYDINFKYDNGSEKRLFLICEDYGEKISFLTLDENSILDANDKKMSSSKSVDEFTKNFIKHKFPDSNFLKLPILEKLKQLANASTLTLVIRDQELTRGGEYIELAFLLGSSRSQSSRIFFLGRRDCELSGMVWEILDHYGIIFRPFKDEDDLVTESIRIIRNFILKNY